MLAAIETTQRAEFECGYLTNTPYKMFTAHQYKIEVTVSSNQGRDANGVIIEFSDLKKIVESVLPHNRFIYCKADQDGTTIANALHNMGITACGYDFVISAENLVQYFAEAIQHILDGMHPGVLVEDVKLRENTNSYTRWQRTHCSCGGD